MYLKRCNNFIVGIAVILLLIAPALSFSSGTAKADTRILYTDPSISLNDTEIYVDISSTNVTLVNLTGYVVWWAGLMDEGYVLGIELMCATQGDFRCEIDPNVILLTKRKTTQNFTVSLFIPNGTTSTVPIIINVSGISTFVDYGWNLHTQQLTNATATIHVNPYYDLSLECNKPKLAVKEGDQCVFQIKVRNLGNGPDTYRFDVLNSDDLSDKGVAIALSATNVTLDEGMDYVVKMSVITPKDHKLSKVDINFVAYSLAQLQRNGTGVENLTLTLDIKKDYTREVCIGGLILLPAMFLGLAVFVVVSVVKEKRKRKRQ